MTKTWHLFRFRQASEEKVIRACLRAGWEPVAPRAKSYRKSGKNRLRKSHLVPAFHGYLIIGFPSAPPFRQVCDLHHSLKVVLMDGRPCRIPAAQMDRLFENPRLRLSDAQELLKSVEPDPTYEPGDMIEILGGGMDGMQARIFEVDHFRRRAKVVLAGGPKETGALYDLKIEVPLTAVHKDQVDQKANAA